MIPNNEKDNQMIPNLTEGILLILKSGRENGHSEETTQKALDVLQAATTKVEDIHISNMKIEDKKGTVNMQEE